MAIRSDIETQFKECSNAEEGKKLYRKLSKIYHPDISGGSDEKFKVLNEVYERYQKGEFTHNQYSSSKSHTNDDYDYDYDYDYDIYGYKRYRKEYKNDYAIYNAEDLKFKFKVTCGILTASYKIFRKIRNIEDKRHTFYYSVSKEGKGGEICVEILRININRDKNKYNIFKLKRQLYFTVSVETYISGQISQVTFEQYSSLYNRLLEKIDDDIHDLLKKKLSES